MKLGNIRRVAKEELTGAPSWVDPMLTAYNDFMEQATQALQSKLTYGDNFLCIVKTNQFQSGTELVIANPFTGNTRPIGIHPIFIDGTNLIDSYRLTYKSTNNELGITFNFKAPDSYLFLTRNANQSIANTTNTSIVWTTAQSATGSFLLWNAATNPSRITISNSGNYLFTYTGAYANNAVGARTFWLSKNGVLAGTGNFLGLSKQLGSAVENTASSGSFVFNGLIAGDYIQLWTYQNSGGALNALGNQFEEVQITATYLGGNTDISANVTYILIGG